MQQAVTSPTELGAPERPVAAPERERSSSSLASGSVAMVASLGLNAVVVLAFQAVTGRVLSTAEFGLLGVGISLIMILGLFVLSAFPWVVVRSMSGGGGSAIFKAALAGNVVLGAVVTAGLYGLYELGVLHLDAEYRPIVLLVGATTLLAAVGNTLVAALQGRFRFLSVAAVRTLSAVMLIGVGVPLAVLGMGPAGAIAGFAVASLVLVIVGLYFTRGMDLWRGRWTAGNVYMQALPLLVGVMGTQLLMNVNILGVKLFARGDSDTLAGFFQGALVLARVPVFLMIALMGALYPFVARHADDPERVRWFTSAFVRYSLIFLLPLALIMAVSPERVLTLVFPAEYEAAARTLALLSLGMFLLALVAVLATVFQALGRAGLPGAVVGGSVVLQMGLSYWLAPVKGNEGVAVATIVSCGAALTLLAVAYARCYGSPVSMGVLARTALATVTLVFALLALPELSEAWSVAVWAGAYASYVLISLVAGLLTSEDVRLFLSPLGGAGKVGDWTTGAADFLGRAAR